MKTFKVVMLRFFIYGTLYFAFGVLFPLKLFYINMICMNYINVALFALNDFVMTTVFLIRDVI